MKPIKYMYNILILSSSILSITRSITRTFSIQKNVRFDSILDLIGSPNADVGCDHVIADVGCDHALLSILLANRYNHISKIYALDVSAAALESAAKTLLLQSPDIQSKVNIIESKGLNAIISKNIKNISTIVVAGMGTNTAKDICNHDHLDYINCNNVILQPWPPHIVPVLNLYKHFTNNNWKIDDQRIIQSGYYQHLTTKFIRCNKNNNNNNDNTNDKYNSISSWPLTQRLLQQSGSSSSSSTTIEYKVFIDYLNNQNNNFFRVKQNKPKPDINKVNDNNNNSNNNDNDIITNAEKDIIAILEKYQ